MGPKTLNTTVLLHRVAPVSAFVTAGLSLR